MKRIGANVAFILIFSVFMLSLQARLLAQEACKEEGARKVAEMDERLRESLKERKSAEQEKKDMASLSGSGSRDPLMPLAPPPAIADQLTNEKYMAALREYYDYNVSGLRHRHAVFKWQLLSSKVIFVVVLMLVFAGIYFAAVQFHRPLKRGDKAGALESEVDVTIKGIKVRSPVLGVVILVISLVFFYLYLVYVYPINEIL